MNSGDVTTRSSEDKIIARFVQCLHEEYTKTEAQPAGNDTHRQNAEWQDEYMTRIVAAWDGESPLTDADFIQVPYQELRASGISFWIGHPPTTPFFVVVFETNNKLSAIKSRVESVKLDPAMDNVSYLVDSMFDGPIELDFTPSLLAAE